MPKIALIGAGSLGFTRRLTIDILSHDLLKKSVLSLMDIDRERLGLARKCVERVVKIV